MAARKPQPCGVKCITALMSSVSRLVWVAIRNMGLWETLLDCIKNTTRNLQLIRFRNLQSTNWNDLVLLAWILYNPGQHNPCWNPMQNHFCWISGKPFARMLLRVQIKHFDPPSSMLTSRKIKLPAFVSRPHFAGATLAFFVFISWPAKCSEGLPDRGLYENVAECPDFYSGMNATE